MAIGKGLKWIYVHTLGKQQELDVCLRQMLAAEVETVFLFIVFCFKLIFQFRDRLGLGEKIKTSGYFCDQLLAPNSLQRWQKFTQWEKTKQNTGYHGVDLKTTLKTMHSSKESKALLPLSDKCPIIAQQQWVCLWWDLPTFENSADSEKYLAKRKLVLLSLAFVASSCQYAM